MVLACLTLHQNCTPILKIVCFVGRCAGEFAMFKSRARTRLWVAHLNSRDGSRGSSPVWLDSISVALEHFVSALSN